MRRRPLAVVFVLSIVLAAWWLGLRGRTKPPAGDRGRVAAPHSDLMPWFREPRKVLQDSASGSTPALSEEKDIGGTVRNALTGALIAEAEVRLQRGARVIDVTWTDSTGRFLFPPDPSRPAREFESVAAKAAGFSPGVAWVDEETRDDVALFVFPAVTISGTVVDAAGNRVRGASVTAIGEERDALEVTSTKVTSDEDGVFRISDAPSGRVRLEAADPSGLGSTSQPIGIPAPGANVEGIVLRLDARARVSGFAHAGGVPLAGLDVALFFPGGMSEPTVTDSNGKFHFDAVVPGEGSVLARDGLGEAGFEARAGEETAVDLPVWLGPLLEGSILDEEGRPVPQARITVLDCDRDHLLPGVARPILDAYSRVPLPFDQNTPTPFPITLDATGHFASRNIPCASVTLSVKVFGGGYLAERRERVPIPSRQDFRLRRGIPVHGIIVDADGKLCPTANDFVYVLGEGTGGRYEVHAGHFTLTGLPDGQFEAEYSSRTLGNGKGKFEIAGARTETVRVVVSGTTRATARLLSAGKPVAGATMCAASVDESGVYCGDGRYKGLSGPDGQVTISMPLDLSNIRIESPQFETVDRADLHPFPGELLDLGTVELLPAHE